MSLQRWRVAGPLSSLVPGATVTWNLCTEDQTVRKGHYQGVATVRGDGQAGSQAPTATQPRMNDTCREMSGSPTYIPPILQDLP